MSDGSFSNNGVHQAVPVAGAYRVPALVIGLIAVPLLMLVMIPLAMVISSRMGKPAFTTIDELNTGDIRRFEVELQNLKSSYKPDRKEDALGPYVANAGDYDRLVSILRTATPIDELPPKVFLGTFTIQLKDGKQQVIRLSFITESQNSPVKRFAYKIGSQSFLGGAVSELVSIAEACDPRPQKP